MASLEISAPCFLHFLFAFSAAYFLSFYVFVLSSYIYIYIYLCVFVCLFGLVHIPTEHILKPSHPSVHPPACIEEMKNCLTYFNEILFSGVLLKFMSAFQFGLKS